MTDAAKPLFVSEIVVRWGDQDAYGHVNNTNFFRYMEQARFDWMQGIVHQLPRGEGPVLVHTGCTFLQQLRFPATIAIGIHVDAVGRSSMDMRFDISGKDDGVLYAQGTAKVVWISFAQGKSVPIPDLIRSMLPASS